MRVICVMVVVVSLGVFGATGCGVSTAERAVWYEARLTEARNLAETIDAELDPALEQLARLQEQLSVLEANDPDHALTKRLRSAVAQTTRAIESAQARRTRVLGVIASAEASVRALKRPSAGWGDELLAAGRAGKEVAPMTGPAAPWVYLGSSLLAALGGLLVRRPGDVGGKDARQREDDAWDEADDQAFDRGLRIGRAEGRLDHFGAEQKLNARKP